MPEQPTEGQIRRVLNAEYLTAPSGTQLKRKINPDGTRTPWAPKKGDGTKYQVTGDATFMRYESNEDAPSPTSCPDYHTSFEMARLAEGQEDVVRRCIEAEAPPWAEDRASVRENCQGWCIRVLKRLREAGVVSEEWVGKAGEMEEPV